MSFVGDIEAETRSLMNKQPSLCNGESNGRSCVFYWAHVEKVESGNADHLRLGQVFRICGYHPSLALEMDKLAVRCNRYEPRRLPMWKRPLALLRIIDDPGRFQEDYEVYKPLTPADVQALQPPRSFSERSNNTPAEPEVSLDDAFDGDNGIFSP